MKHYLYVLAVVLFSLSVFSGCSDDETEPESLFSLTLEVSQEGAGTVTGDGEYQAGQQVEITATANKGWEFFNWTGDTDHVDDATAAIITFTMPAQDISLSANFLVAVDPEPFTVIDVDGNVYPTVIIGTQEWMAENLRVSRYNNMDAIPADLDRPEWSATTQGASAIYPGFEEAVETYGKLYNWYAVNDERGLCPAGWRVPSDDDWSQLVDYVAEQGFLNHSNDSNGAANALKSCRQSNSPFGGDCDTSEHPRWNQDGNHNGFDEFGFSALPGGNRLATGYFRNAGEIGLWWTSTDITPTVARQRNMASYFGHVVQFTGDKTLGLNIRCVREADVN